MVELLFPVASLQTGPFSHSEPIPHIYWRCSGAIQVDDFDFDTSLWDEIQDMSGEIFDIDGYIEEMSKTEDFPMDLEVF